MSQTLSAAISVVGISLSGNGPVPLFASGSFRSKVDVNRTSDVDGLCKTKSSHDCERREKQDGKRLLQIFVPRPEQFRAMRSHPYAGTVTKRPRLRLHSVGLSK
jgi:hypothetical protein